MVFAVCPANKYSQDSGTLCTICCEGAWEGTIVDHLDHDPFHEECLANFINSELNQNTVPKCPNCRIIIVSFKDLPINPLQNPAHAIYAANEALDQDAIAIALDQNLDGEAPQPFNNAVGFVANHDVGFEGANHDVGFEEADAGARMNFGVGSGLNIQQREEFLMREVNGCLDHNGEQLYLDMVRGVLLTGPISEQVRNNVAEQCIIHENNGLLALVNMNRQQLLAESTRLANLGLLPRLPF